MRKRLLIIVYHLEYGPPQTPKGAGRSYLYLGLDDSAMKTYRTQSDATSSYKSVATARTLNLRPTCIECPSHNFQLYPEDFTSDEFTRINHLSRQLKELIGRYPSYFKAVKHTKQNLFGQVSGNHVNQRRKSIKLNSDQTCIIGIVLNPSTIQNVNNNGTTKANQ